MDNPKKINCLFFLFITICYLNTPLFAEEITLRMLVWEPYLASQRIQQSFIKLVKEKFNVELKLDVKYVSSDDVFYKALRDNTADAVSLSHSTPKDKRFQLIKLNLALPLDLSLIPNYTNVIKKLREEDYCRENGQLYCVPMARGPYGLAYNTKYFDHPPDSWKILWDPKYKNKYTLGRDQYEQNVYNTALAMGYSVKDISNYKKLNTQKFQKKLAQLAINAHSLWVGVDKAKDLKGLYLAVSWGTALPELKTMGELWEMAQPKEGTTAWLDNFMLNAFLEKKPTHKRIAIEWLNYITSNEYQQYIVRGMGAEPVTTNVKNVLTNEEINRLNLNASSAFENKYILWPILNKTDRKGLKRLWDKALMEREKSLQQ